ncbi:MAG: hypothetical protein K2N72_10600 [Oscillospiraceae bacterium]|nr:hypothetical protein [Oscillospiraceae bacterium]
MKKKIAALTAVILTMSMAFTACGNKNPEETVTEAEINIITDGELVSSEGADGSETTTAEFVDPAELLGLGSDVLGTEAPSEEGDSAETTLPENHDAVVSMIEAGGTTAPKTAVMADYNIDCTTRYGYKQLNEAEQKLYRDILEAAKSVRLKVDLDESVTDEMWVKVFGIVYNQEPELFWLSAARTAKGKLWYWEIDPDIIAGMQKEIDAKVSEILTAVQGKSDWEKLEYFHDYIVLHNNFVKDDNSSTTTIYNSFIGGNIQCSGYAKSMQYLCDLSGIESLIVVGTNDVNASHAWNVIKVDGKWYNMDTTWDDPILTNVDVTNIRHRYFLVPDEWIHEKSHFNINKKITGTQVTYFTPPACTDTALNYFSAKNRLYSDKDSADKALREALKSCAQDSKRTAEIRVSDKSVYDALTSSASLKEYASWIKGENSKVTSVSSSCDPNTLTIELNLAY